LARAEADALAQWNNDRSLRCRSDRLSDSNDPFLHAKAAVRMFTHALRFFEQDVKHEQQPHQRAQVAKGTIYLYFRDKGSLFQELVRSMLK
jgi:hypothetical protein